MSSGHNFSYKQGNRTTILQQLSHVGPQAAQVVTSPTVNICSWGTSTRPGGAKESAGSAMLFSGIHEKHFFNMFGIRV